MLRILLQVIVARSVLAPSPPKVLDWHRVVEQRQLQNLIQKKWALVLITRKSYFQEAQSALQFRSRLKDIYHLQLLA